MKVHAPQSDHMVHGYWLDHDRTRSRLDAPCARPGCGHWRSRHVYEDLGIAGSAHECADCAAEARRRGVKVTLGTVCMYFEEPDPSSEASVAWERSG